MLTGRIIAIGVVLGLGAAAALSQTLPTTPPASPAPAPATAPAALSATAPTAAPAALPAPAPGDAVVTTDSAEYCDTLADRVNRAEKASPDAPRQEAQLAAQLADEGHHMCAAGLIRGGLVRLRRALLMLRTDK